MPANIGSRKYAFAGRRFYPSQLPGLVVPDATAGILVTTSEVTNLLLPVTGTLNGKNTYGGDWPPLNSSCQMIFLAGEGGLNGWFFQADNEGMGTVFYDYTGANVQYPWLAGYPAPNTVSKQTTST